MRHILTRCVTAVAGLITNRTHSYRHSGFIKRQHGYTIYPRLTHADDMGCKESMKNCTRVLAGHALGASQGLTTLSSTKCHCLRPPNSIREVTRIAEIAASNLAPDQNAFVVVSSVPILHQNPAVRELSNIHCYYFVCVDHAHLTQIKRRAETKRCRRDHITAHTTEVIHFQYPRNTPLNRPPPTPTVQSVPMGNNIRIPRKEPGTKD
ncbi:hypothetical protein AB1N83_007560 [Pleurotus pulmonarius]